MYLHSYYVDLFVYSYRSHYDSLRSHKRKQVILKNSKLNF